MRTFGDKANKTFKKVTTKRKGKAKQARSKRS